MRFPVERTFIAECFWPGVAGSDVIAAANRVRSSARELSVSGPAVELTGSLVMLADEVVLYLFKGPSLEAVRAACERADVPFERVVESVGMTELQDGKGVG